MINAKWPVKRIRDLFEIGAGKTLSAAARLGEDKVPFLRTSNVFWDRLDLTNLDQMAIPAHELANKSLRLGDLLVCEGGEIGRAAIWDGSIEPISFQNHLHRLRPKRSDVEPRFYALFLQSAFTQLGIFGGAGNKTTIPNLSSSRLGALEVPHPPLSVQQAIVTALSAAREATVAHSKATETAFELKRAAMAELFTRGLRGASPQETALGKFPGEWKQIRIGDLGKVVTGTTPPTKDPANYTNGAIPFVAPGDFGHGERITSTGKMLSNRGLALSRPIPAGSTCFVCIGSTIGKVGVTTDQICVTNQQINTVIASGGFEPRYVFHLLTRWADHIKRHASPSPVPILSKGAFERIEVVASTDPDEQAEIADILDSLDRKIDLHRRRLKLLEDLHRSLLHKLMTGEVDPGDIVLPQSVSMSRGSVT